MKKHAYFNGDTQELKEFTHAESLKLGDSWQKVPKIENMINDEGKHQVRLHFNDFTVDIIETDESMDESMSNESIISNVEVASDVKSDAS